MARVRSFVLLLSVLAVLTAMALPRASYVYAYHRAYSSNKDNYSGLNCTRSNTPCRHTGICGFDNSGFFCRCEHCRYDQPTNYICGDDGVTYSSYCEFKRQQCRQNKKVSIKSKGPCNNACRQKREDAIYQQATGFIAKGYVPACEPKDDSKYKPTQCNKTQILECWCVTPSTNEGITKPRLVQRESDLDCEQELEILRLKQICDPCPTVTQLYQGIMGAQDYGKYVERTIRKSGHILDTVNETALSQELFAQFDGNLDNQLSEGEMKIIARWRGMNLECLTSTLMICDKDKNKLISMDELFRCVISRYILMKQCH